MKISFILVAGAQGCGNLVTCRDWNPQSCDYEEWVENNLWASAVESFNFASNNWEEFTNAVKSVSRIGHFRKRNNKIFQFDVTFRGHDVFQSPFRYIDTNKDSEISAKEFKNELFSRGPFEGHFDEFFAEYWPIFDTDNSGTLNFEETMYCYAAITDGEARLVLKVRKLSNS